ncbi:hypothetical protein FOTG_14718 [Fusarium oxysporum f. sp. vasinfectum 25433]|uniref:Uncharacterized protein n=1 Tax=Fusarium oxysporum f. sp. vasinfectum 25433 TaxID=1089449 RepID=X0M8L9_FUSOX|nr:hypothetical protein FOTG_14718 [Fusarium oxysporum f. sp. vasinfectum 25433]
MPYLPRQIPNLKKVTTKEAKAKALAKEKAKATKEAKGKAAKDGKGKGKGKGKPKKEAEPISMVDTVGGGIAVVKAPQLRKFYKDLHETGRVAMVEIEHVDKGKGKEKA